MLTSSQSDVVRHYLNVKLDVGKDGKTTHSPSIKLELTGSRARGLAVPHGLTVSSIHGVLFSRLAEFYSEAEKKNAEAKLPTSATVARLSELPTPAAPCGDVNAKVVPAGPAGSVVHYHNVTTGGGGAAFAPMYEAPVPAVVDRDGSSNIADLGGELQKLADLHASGGLSDEEFAQVKQKILGLGA